MLPFGRILRRSSRPATSPPRDRIRLQPDEQTIYAIGDVHGCVSQLRALEEMIARDAEATPQVAKTIVVLGDLVDRGPDTSAVVDYLMRPLPANFSRVVLAGNHEIDMLTAFEDPKRARQWLSFGGIETLRSYGVELSALPQSRREVEAAMLAASSSVPRLHLEFLRGLPVAALWRQFVFVHAGCMPGVAVAEQRETDLVTIREPFLSGWGEGDTIVVHGHTPAAAARKVGSRIQVDTACYATGRLSAARIDADGVRFLSTSSEG